MPNITTNHAVTYTNTFLNSLRKNDVANATLRNKCKNQKKIHRRDILWHKDRMRLQQAV